MSETKKVNINDINEVKIKPSKLSEDKKNFILSLKREDITRSMLKKLFAYKHNKSAYCNTNDFFTLPKDKLFNNTSISTTAGRYIFNLFTYSPKILALIGYQNEPMDSSNIGKVEKLLSYNLLDDKLNTNDIHEYIDRSQWLGYTLSRFMMASLTHNILIPNEKIEEEKARLIAKYQKAIDNNDIAQIIKLEKELLEFSKKHNCDIPDMELFNSGSKASYSNNYKNMVLMRGATKKINDESDVKISTSSLIDGISTDEIDRYADLMLQASFNRAIGTREGGYESKKITTATQDIKLDAAGSDCGSKFLLRIKLTKDILDLYMYRYIVDNKGNLIQLNLDNINDYIDKEVNLRSPLFCNGDHYCSKCMGELYYKLGNIENIGFLIQRESESILKKSLKKFHDMTIHMVNFNIEDYIN